MSIKNGVRNFSVTTSRWCFPDDAVEPSVYDFIEGVRPELPIHFVCYARHTSDKLICICIEIAQRAKSCKKNVCTTCVQNLCPLSLVHSRGA